MNGKKNESTVSITEKVSQILGFFMPDTFSLIPFFGKTNKHNLLNLKSFALLDKYCPSFYIVEVFYLASDLVKKRFYTRGTLGGIRILELAKIRFLYRDSCSLN